MTSHPMQNIRCPLSLMRSDLCLAGESSVTIHRQRRHRIGITFKQFITCWEKSNGTTIQWGAGFASQFVNTKIGAVYGEVENEYNGKVSMRREVRWFCPVDEAAGADAPEPKYLSGNAPKMTETKSDGFVDMPKTDEPDLPFN